MSSQPPIDPLKEENAPSAPSGYGPLLITILMFLGVISLLFHWSPVSLNWPYSLSKVWFNPGSLLGLGSANWVTSPLPLAMAGGDPHIRALMRTISASESNMDRPYHLLYGGQTLKQLTHHPDLCIPIETGPNVGDCTTAAGRYQFLTTTWQSKAEQYHPEPPVWFEFWQSYDFSPKAQDMVVYRWLSDPDAWGVDIAQQLKAGEITSVLELLSGTWTSLGYGIETNSMSSQLPSIYDDMLEEELSNP
ncbi:glycoside hydrolase family 24 protein [Leptothoe sp. PORK10 BA2]|uniref:glycoside hydrolase family 24 protein n=1 Tax=Leptothoe sp. PORK10 BA2 TaxID=3110254 RepID=UPI002B216B1B|nr:glycoside hydrolase family protein [Leptothoe sp. PORK10 BA2]MEA5466752.1 glycoside hydrolase family protein [Leptothoe sp. PORK10 BA2]